MGQRVVAGKSSMTDVQTTNSTVASQPRSFSLASGAMCAKNDTEIYKITEKFVSKLWEERERMMGASK